MAQLDADFERKAREAFLDNAEARLYGERDNLAFEFLTDANERLNDYGRRNDYATENVADSGHVAETQRTRSGVSARLEWDHPAAGLMETGTSRHPVEGEPLAFEWPDAPADIRRAFADTFPTVFFNKVEVSGLPAARYVRDTIASWRAKLQRRGTGGRFR